MNLKDFNLLIWILMVYMLLAEYGKPYIPLRAFAFYFIATAGVLFLMRGAR